MPWVKRRIGRPVTHTGWGVIGDDGLFTPIMWVEVPLKTVWEDPPMTNTVRHFQETGMIRDEVEQAATRPQDWTGSTDPLLKDYPSVNEYLTCAVTASGKPRDCCALKIVFGIDQVQVQLQDAQNDRGMSTTACTVKEALKLMEAHIVKAGVPAWRSWGFKKKK